MIDSLKHISGNNYPEQIATFVSGASAVNVNDTIGFVGGMGTVDINPELMVNGQDNFIGIVLLVLIFFIALIWYFSPDLLVRNFKPLTANIFSRNYDSFGNTSGLVVNTLLYFNFLIVSSLLIFSLINNVLSDFLDIGIEWNSFYLIVLAMVLLVILRYVSIKLTGFIFKTNKMASQQNKLYNSMEKSLGLISLPLLLFSIYINLHLFLYLSIVVLLLFLLSRWVFTIAIGIRVSNFSWFHIILYLCTLEIIPFMFMIKILRDYISGVI